VTAVPTNYNAAMRYRLRTLLILLAVVGCILAYHANWIAQRRVARKHFYKCNEDGLTKAPLALRLFGETGVTGVLIEVPIGMTYVKHRNDGRAIQSSFEPIQTARRLFPEAAIGALAEYETHGSGPRMMIDVDVD
jgi:hypothetical protein